MTHEIFNQPIATLDEAKALFLYLHQHFLTFHPEDDAAEIINVETGAEVFTKEESAALNVRMAEAYALEWGEHECPCGFILSLDAP